MPRPTLLATSAVVLVCGCAKPDLPVPSLAPPPAASGPAAPEPASGSRDAASAAPVMDCSTPRKTNESQYRAIVEGAPLELIARCFTSRLQERITAEMLVKAKDVLAELTFGELYGTEQPSPNAVKVKGANGRSLTTLVREGDVWKADTLWFK